MSFGGVWATGRTRDTRCHLDPPSLLLLAVADQWPNYLVEGSFWRGLFGGSPRYGFAVRVKICVAHSPSFLPTLALPCFAVTLQTWASQLQSPGELPLSSPNSREGGPQICTSK